jgi:lipooligosaccharide transport system ATP-binding protein
MNGPVIKVDNVSKTYGSISALKDLSFSVDEASCFSLLGPNGAGKSTMMKIIYGICPRDRDARSSVSIFGFDPGDDELAIKYLSGVVPQDNNLDEELNIEENLFVYARFYGITGKKARERIGFLLDFMELAERKKASIKELSGGMKRRLVIARALLNEPRLLILDEPSTGLDPQVRHLIWEKLRRLKQDGTTLLLTTHYMEEASQLADQVLIMNRGSKVIQGHPSDLLRDNVEKYVLELSWRKSSEKIRSLAVGEGIRIDESGEITRLFSNDFDRLNTIASGFDHREHSLRLSNLEDVFLKTTGRKLNEQQ